jgi:hypothetical protein
MDRQSPTYRDFNPTGDERVAQIKGGADELIKYVRAHTLASGPETQRRASIAVTNFEQGAMWAVKALFSEDAISFGGAGTPAGPRIADPGPEHDGETDP